jgi:transposase
MTQRRTSSRVRAAAWIVAAVLILGAAAGGVGSLLANPGDPAPVLGGTSGPATAAASPTADPGTATAPAPAPAGTAISVLDTLPVKGRAPATGYSRTGEFGSAWLDVDHNGCDTRNDILARDLTSTVRDERCRVLSGILDDAYTGRSIRFTRGETTSAQVQIDHMVPLLNAWETGAQQLTRAQRIALANDPRNLIAVDGPSNQQKSAGDAATWLPSNKTFRCEYVARQIAVKATYRLWVTRAEHDAMARVLSGCPGQRTQ